MHEELKTWVELISEILSGILTHEMILKTRETQKTTRAVVGVCKNTQALIRHRRCTQTFTELSSYGTRIRDAEKKVCIYRYLQRLLTEEPKTLVLLTNTVTAQGRTSFSPVFVTLHRDRLTLDS